MNTTLYDNVIKVAVANFYTLSKDSKKINLVNFDFKNENHLCILNIAHTVQILFNTQVSVSTTWLKFFYYKLKYKLKWCKRSKSLEGIDVNDFISHIESSNNLPNIFQNIYSAYYKGEDDG